MQELGTKEMMDYTAVPVGLRIEGRLWTGQPTAFTAICPKCGRIGVVSARQNGGRTVVHAGRVDGKTLAGIDFCMLGVQAPEFEEHQPDDVAGLHANHHRLAEFTNNLYRSW